MRRVQRIGLLAGSILLAVSTGAYPAIFDHDDRQYVSTVPGSPYSPVGLVSRGLLVEHHTTGILVSDCDVLTSQHILGYGRSPLGQRLRFEGARGTPQRISSYGTVVAVGGLKRVQTAAEQFDAGGQDWLLLRLDKCIGATLGHAILKSGPVIPDELRSVESAGYPQDRSRDMGLTIDPSCRITGARGTVLLNDCAALPGNSGGPIFRLSASRSKPQMEVYAIQTAAYTWAAAVPFTPGYDNQATPATLILPQIERYLSAPARRSAGAEDTKTPKSADAISNIGGSAGIPSDRRILDTSLGGARR
jgi:V8-like Glu-specific endopeptidase